MSKFIELEQFRYSFNNKKGLYPLLLNLSNVIAVCREDDDCVVYTSDACFHVSADNYDKLCAALKAYKEDNIADKLCELQNDHTWVMQALTNVLIMCKGDKTSFNPAILLDCYDKDMERLYGEVQGAVRDMQERIKELKNEFEIMIEPKKPSNV
ncbi:hypothetical protein [Bacteroides pyogenes]|uniref:hypothetical protein n=1 Tax=Bacteroides pyogenes TaxID=310300 RepID=UPI002FD8FAFE